MTSAELRSETARTPARRPRLPVTRSRLGTMAVLAIVVGFVVLQFGRQVYASYAINERVAELRDEIRATDAENRGLAGVLEYLRSDAYVSQEARRLADLGAPDERILIIPEGAEAELPAALQTPAPASRPLLEQWLDLFFGPRAGRDPRQSKSPRTGCRGLALFAAAWWPPDPTW